MTGRGAHAAARSDVTASGAAPAAADGADVCAPADTSGPAGTSAPAEMAGVACAFERVTVIRPIVLEQAYDHELKAPLLWITPADPSRLWTNPARYEATRGRPSRPPGRVLRPPVANRLAPCARRIRANSSD